MNIYDGPYNLLGPDVINAYTALHDALDATMPPCVRCGKPAHAVEESPERPLCWSCRCPFCTCETCSVCGQCHRCLPGMGIFADALDADEKSV